MRLNAAFIILFRPLCRRGKNGYKKDANDKIKTITPTPLSSLML